MEDVRKKNENVWCTVTLLKEFKGYSFTKFSRRPNGDVFKGKARVVLRLAQGGER